MRTAASESKGVGPIVITAIRPPASHGHRGQAGDRIDLQRGADAEHQIGTGGERFGLRHRLGGKQLAEQDDVGLHVPAALESRSPRRIRTKRPSTSSLGYRAAQSRQLAVRIEPWTSITRSEPALEWSVSMFWVITASSRPRRSSSARASMGAVRLLLAEHLETLPVEAPETGRIAFEGVDVGDLHRVDLLPDPLARRAEIRDPAGHGDPRARSGRRCSCDSRISSASRWAWSGCYLPCHLALRFCRKAEMPSLPSSERKAVAKPCFSASMPSSRSPL